MCEIEIVRLSIHSTDLCQACIPVHIVLQCQFSTVVNDPLIDPDELKK